MPGINRKQAIKSDMHAKNIHKRGLSGPSAEERKRGVGPAMLAMFVFVVIGSAIIQIISASKSGVPPP